MDLWGVSFWEFLVSPHFLFPLLSVFSVDVISQLPVPAVAAAAGCQGSPGLMDSPSRNVSQNKLYSIVAFGYGVLLWDINKKVIDTHPLQGSGNTLKGGVDKGKKWRKRRSMGRLLLRQRVSCCAPQLWAPGRDLACHHPVKEWVGAHGAVALPEGLYIINNWWNRTRLIWNFIYFVIIVLRDWWGNTCATVHTWRSEDKFVKLFPPPLCGLQGLNSRHQACTISGSSTHWGLSLALGLEETSSSKA